MPMLPWRSFPGPSGGCAKPRPPRPPHAAPKVEYDITSSTEVVGTAVLRAGMQVRLVSPAQHDTSAHPVHRGSGLPDKPLPLKLSPTALTSRHRPILPRISLPLGLTSRLILRWLMATPRRALSDWTSGRRRRCSTPPRGCGCRSRTGGTPATWLGPWRHACSCMWSGRPGSRSGERRGG